MKRAERDNWKDPRGLPIYTLNRIKHDYVYNCSNKIKEKIASGEMRAKYGLDTSLKSNYFYYRSIGLSDNMAQYAVYKARGVI